MMKTTLVWTMILFTLSLSIGLPHTAAVDTSTWGLPEGAKVRLGKGTLSKITYSPDGELLAVTGSAGTWIYDAKNLKEQSLLRVWDGVFDSNSMTVVGKTLNAFGFGLSTNQVNEIQLYDVVTGAKKDAFEASSWPFAYSSDSNLLAIGGFREVLVLDTETKSHSYTIGHQENLDAIAFSPDGETLVTNAAGIVRLWDVTRGRGARLIAVLDSEPDYYDVSFAFSPDGSTLAGTSRYGVTVWDAWTGQLKTALEIPNVSTVAYSPDGTTLASGRSNIVYLWETETWTQKAALKSPFYPSWLWKAIAFAYSPDGTTLAVGQGDHSLWLWDVAKISARIKEHNEIEYNRDNKIVLDLHWSEEYGHYLEGDAMLQVPYGSWQIKHLPKFSFHDVMPHVPYETLYPLAYLPDGDTIVVENMLWDVATGSPKGTLSGADGNIIDTKNILWMLWGAPTGSPKGIFGADGITLFARGDFKEESVRLHNHDFRAVALSPDGKTLATAGDTDRTLQLWNAETKQLIRTLQDEVNYIASLAFSPDGKILASGPELELWNAVTGQHIRGRITNTTSFAFSPDGNTLATSTAAGSSTNSGTIWLYDIQALLSDKYSVEHIFEGHTGSINALAFSPDGTTLASRSIYGDGTVLLWDVTPYIDITLPPGPTVTILTSSIGQIYDHSQPTITGEFSGVASQVSLSLTLNGVAVQAEVSGNEFTYTPADALGNGEYSLVVVATDANGNTAETSLTFTVEVPTVEPDPSLTLQSDTFDGSGQNLQSFWQVQNGDKSSWELKDGQLVVDPGPNQDLWINDTSTRFYQVTDQDQFTVETSMLVDYADVCAVSGLVVTSPTTESSYGTGEWVMLKFWGRHGSSVLQFQNRGAGIELPDYNPAQGPTRIAMRLERNGNEYTAWYKPDAEGDWVYVGKTTIALQEPLQVGLYTGICQAEASGHLTTTFDYFRLTSDAMTPEETPEKEEIPYVDATVRFSPSPSDAPRVGEQLMLNLNVAGGESITGYQATVQFDETVLRYVSSTNADFLPADPYIAQPIITGNTVTIAATSLVGETNGDGTLATLTFDVISEEVSTLILTEVLFSDSEGMLTRPHLEPAELIITPKPAYPAWDVNEDGVVDLLDLAIVAQNFGKSASANPRADVNGDNTIDIFDLALIAQHFGESTNAAAPISFARLGKLDPARIKEWLALARIENDGSLAFQQGIANLERLLALLIPKKTALLANYPNPFNPETWIPYQLAKPVMVNVSIYAADGKLIRTLSLGHQEVGVYYKRNRAAYWDGKNEAGESVASGVFFYTLTAGDFTATRKMLILK